MNFIKLNAANDSGKPFEVHLRADVITQVYGPKKGESVILTYNSVVTVKHTPEEVMDLIHEADFQTR